MALVSLHLAQRSNGFSRSNLASSSKYKSPRESRLRLGLWASSPDWFPLVAPESPICEWIVHWQWIFIPSPTSISTPNPSSRLVKEHSVITPDCGLWAEKAVESELIVPFTVICDPGYSDWIMSAWLWKTLRIVERDKPRGTSSTWRRRRVLYRTAEVS
jgi:hypothetical protein